MKKLSRRDFIKGAASSAAIVAAGGLLTACASEPTNDNTPAPSRTWDLETDVLILGAGGSGMCAAYEAAKASGKAVWFLIDIPGLTGGMYFPGNPSDMGIPETEVNSVLEITNYITPTGAPVRAEKPTA